jgi:hypothetical protein
MIRTSVVATIAALALAACASHGIVPSSPTALAPTNAMLPAEDDGGILPLKGKTKTCPKSPPQYEWIFKGACDAFTLKSGGGKFSLSKYDNITVKGSIGKNTAKGSAKIVIADAVDKKGDIEKFGGKSFPKYKGNGKTIAYASANNQSDQTITPIVVKNKPIIQYIITDEKKLPGKKCSAAILTHESGGKLSWDPLPSSFPVKGKSVTISLYTAPNGFELPPKSDQTAIYFAVNCF